MDLAVTAEWYLAELVVRVAVDGEPPVARLDLHLVSASSPGDAYDKAVELGRDSDDEYLDERGRRVRAEWIGLAGLNLIHEPIGDGCELGFSERRGLGDEQIRRLGRRREQLALFATTRDDAPAPEPEVLTIRHAQILLAPGQEQAMRDFYCGLLGFQEIAKPPTLARRGGLWLAAGDRQLHLGVDDAGAAKDRAHLAYEVVGLGRLRERLHAAGAATVDGEQVDGYRRCELRDPAGNRVELMERITAIG